MYARKGMPVCQLDGPRRTRGLCSREEEKEKQ